MHLSKLNPTEQFVAIDPALMDVAFESFPADVCASLLEMRALIVDVQQSLPQQAQLQEVVRWGQLSYLTSERSVGSMIRLGMSSCGRPTLFCHCVTRLIGSFREQYSQTFDFQGNRALIVKGAVSDCREALSDCIAQALTYTKR